MEIRGLGILYIIGLSSQHPLGICMDLPTSHRNYEWLCNLVTGNEKWLLYINYARECQWLSVDQTGTVTPKNDLHPKKVMLSVWWGVKGIIYRKPLPDEYTVTADLYCQQLDRVAQKLKDKRDRIYFLHDDARPHVARSIREKLLEVGWVTIPHLPYSPDLPSTGYHLFRFLSNHPRKKEFDDESNLKTDLVNFFS